jgi:hypothetical protein
MLRGRGEYGFKTQSIMPSCRGKGMSGLLNTIIRTLVGKCHGCDCLSREIYDLG